MVFVFLLLMIEAAVTVDVFLNRNWEEVYALKNAPWILILYIELLTNLLY